MLELRITFKYLILQIKHVVKFKVSWFINNPFIIY